MLHWFYFNTPLKYAHILNIRPKWLHGQNTSWSQIFCDVINYCDIIVSIRRLGTFGPFLLSQLCDLFVFIYLKTTVSQSPYSWCLHCLTDLYQQTISLTLGEYVFCLKNITTVFTSEVKICIILYAFTVCKALILALTA